MGRTGKRSPATRKEDTGEVWAKIVSNRSKYYISRDGLGDDERIDDEAELEIIATIDAITPSQRKHLGQEIVISLLAAQRHAPKGADPVLFFGSVNLRGSQRTALAYLPTAPFWALPNMVREREAWVCVGWTFMRRGNAHLSSLFIGGAEDRKTLLELGGNALSTAE